MRAPRRGVTLVEVLIAIFIMGIGLMAILVLFPLGALNMARALKDDRCASIAANADAMAAARGLRTDPTVVAQFKAAPGNPNGPSNPVFVDAFGVSALLPPTVGGIPNGIPRINPSYIQSPTDPDTWFGLRDDLLFDANGLPTSPTQRQGYFTWAYMVRRLKMGQTNSTQMWVIVYSGRGEVPTSEQPSGVTGGLKNTTSMILTDIPSLRKGSWLLDVSSVNGSVTGQFHRVVEAIQGSGGLQVEVYPQLYADVSNVVFLDGAVEVFDRGTGR